MEAADPLARARVKKRKHKKKRSKKRRKNAKRRRRHRRKSGVSANRARAMLEASAIVRRATKVVGGEDALYKLGKVERSRLLGLIAVAGATGADPEAVTDAELDVMTRNVVQSTSTFVRKDADAYVRDAYLKREAAATYPDPAMDAESNEELVSDDRNYYIDPRVLEIYTLNLLGEVVAAYIELDGV